MKGNKHTLDKIECDHVYKGADIPTEWKFYKQLKEEHPENVIIMRYYDSYHILGDDADKVAPILKDVLTHKDAGRMFIYDTENYSYHRFTSGAHNLNKVMSELTKHNIRVSVSDFNIAFNKWGGWKRADRLIGMAEEERKRAQQKTWVQTSLFDMEGFL